MKVSSARTKLKGLTLFSLAIAGCSFLNIANAYSSGAIPGCSVPNTPTAYSPFNPVMEPLPQSRWYTNIGAEYYAVNLPSYRLPITFGRWVATNPPTLPPTGIDAGFNAANTKAGNTTILPFFSIGYNLKNGSVFLPGYLDQEAIEFNYAQFNRATKDTTNYTGATGVDAGAGYGVIWKIDDTSVPTYGGGALRIVNSFIHSSVHYHDIGLFVKGNIKNLPSTLRSSAKIGIVATGLDQYYAYNINATTQGNTHLPVNSFGDDSVRARYFGLAIGDRIDFQFAPAFGWFVDASVQGLYATTSLIANQTPDADASPLRVYADYRNNIRMTDKHNQFTYRAQASTGLNFFPKLINNANPLRLSVYGGIDEWGYVPQAVTVSAFGASTPHIVEHSMRNYFVGASLTMPIA